MLPAFVSVITSVIFILSGSYLGIKTFHRIPNKNTGLFVAVISVYIAIIASRQILQPFNSPPAFQPSPTPIPQVAASTSAVLREKATVVRVADGDTFEISTGQRVRLIGIDTPETSDPRRPVGCFGSQATAKTKELLLGAVVEMEKDVSETDRYGRLLRYVYKNGLFINEILVREGYAVSSAYPPDVKYQDQFRRAQAEAVANLHGLWSPACQLPTPESTQSSSSSASWQCDCTRSCSALSSCQEAQYQLHTCGCSARDGDNNGVACNGNPLRCGQ